MKNLKYVLTMRPIFGYLLIILLCYSSSITGQINLSQQVNELIKPLVDTKNYSGTLLIAQHDSIMYAESYGQADLHGSAMNFDHQFLLASTSAIFTATAILKLIEEGQLSLETKLSEIMPKFQYGDQITIHHMLAQRSGIPKIEDVAGAMNIGFLSKPQELDDLISLFEGDELLFEPGSQYNHGRSEYIVLARIVELVSGQKFGAYLKEKIFDPLNMSHTGHYDSDFNDKSPGNLAQGLTASGYSELEKAPFVHWSAKSGHASIYSTSADLYKFAKAIISKSLLSAESWNVILRDHGNNVGYGCFIRSNGTIAINGRSPGYSSYMTINPKDSLTVIMLANIYNSLTFFTGPKLEAIARGEAYNIQPLSMDLIDAEYGENVKGKYQFGPDFYNPNGDVQIDFKNGRLFAADAAMIPIKVNGKIIEFVNRSYWSTMKFLEDDSGNYTQLQYDNYIGTKVSNQGIALKIFGLSLLMLLVLFIWKKIF